VEAFEDEQLGVFSSRFVMEDQMPILLVFHEENDDWQFLSSHEEHEDELVLVHLAHVLELDPTLRALESLPKEWKAWRWSVEDEWVREPIPPDQPAVDPS
jgi:hypothetical protein